MALIRDIPLPLRVAAFQRLARFDDVAGVGVTLLHDLLWADGQGVSLAVFPECYLQGYATDRQTIGQRAMALDDPVFLTILTSLRDIRATAVIGVIEQREAAFYNSAVVIPSGEVIGVYAKAHPNEDGFTAGADFPVFAVGGWPFGINICNDANFPATAARVAGPRADGPSARVLCFPLNNMLEPAVADRWRQRSIVNLRQRAVETGCWVVSADVVGQHAGRYSYGCTSIVNPAGVMVAQAAEHAEGVAIADITPASCL